MSEEIVTLENLNASNLPELKGFEQKQNELVEQYPFVEIVDNASYEIAKKHRTALLKGRTTLEAQDKLIASKLSNFRKDVKSITDGLILITLPHEEKQQEEVKRYEQIKENERLEKERLERERIQKIKDKISELETNSYTLINSWDVEVLENVDNFTFSGMETDFDFEEYDILFEQAKFRVKEHLEYKIKSFKEKENQRIENERLAKEKADADAKVEAMQKQLDSERLERESREREEKEKIFEVRKNRLAEIGFNLHSDSCFFLHLELFDGLNYDSIFNADTVQFEEILSDAKKSIQEAKDKKESEQKLLEENAKKESEAKNKAEKENKERIKRLAKDKAIYEKVLDDNLGRFPILFDSNQKEIKDFSIGASNRVTDLFKQLLTELENL